jgi:hypothetical protein
MVTGMRGYQFARVPSVSGSAIRSLGKINKVVPYVTAMRARLPSCAANGDRRCALMFVAVAGMALGLVGI